MDKDKIVISLFEYRALLETILLLSTTKDMLENRILSYQLRIENSIVKD